jgi:uncharacterized membrane protein YqjE
MLTLAFIIAAVGILIMLIIFVLASGDGIDPGAAVVFICVVAAVTGIAFVFTLNKSHISTCKQVTISTKNGIRCSTSKGSK